MKSNPSTTSAFPLYPRIFILETNIEHATSRNGPSRPFIAGYYITFSA